MARFQGDSLKRNLELVDKFAELAKLKGCAPGQLALAWLVAQGDNVFAIPGTKKIKYLEENFGALQVNIDENEEQEVRRLVEAAEISGDRDTSFGAYLDTAPAE
jgi:aryl-alcohol dehydrogenase-like predicted oxidoreductase